MGATEIRMQVQQVRELAYRFWENDGRPHGRDLEYWLKAERSLTSSGGPADSTRTRMPEPAPLLTDRSGPAITSLQIKPNTRKSSTPRKAPARKKGLDR